MLIPGRRKRCPFVIISMPENRLRGSNLPRHHGPFNNGNPGNTLSAGTVPGGCGLCRRRARRPRYHIGGGEQGFHRPFTIRARIAVLLAGMIVADANDQYRDAGILRLNALERMESQGIDPVFALSVAAWDAANRNPLRPEDILHQFGSSYPALTAAKAALDALHLRRSRNAAPSTPTH